MAGAQSVIASKHAAGDFPLNADPKSTEWVGVAPTIAENSPVSGVVSGHRTEIRTRWTARYLYVLFVCPYQELFLKPNPVIDKETNQLWNWDVAELFIGWDFQNIQRYKEFEISPRGEWVDLDIDRKHPLEGGGVSWNSGFESKTRIDQQHKIWYGEMKIPFASIAPEAPQAGQRFRVNFYRMQGPDRNEIAWQPTHSRSFHVPEAFGILQLEPSGQ